MRLSVTWKIFPYLLLAVYIGTVTYSFYNFNQRLNDVLNRPVQVLQYAREIMFRLQEMRHMLPGLMATPDLSYEDFLAIVERQEALQDRSFDNLKELMRGDPQTLVQLQIDFDKIRALRREAAGRSLGSGDYAEAMHLYKTLIAPQVTAINEGLNHVIDSAQTVLKDKRRETEKDVLLNTLLTLVVGILIALSFMAVNRQEARRTRQLGDRERLFNQLSQNVDEVFIIATGPTNFDYATANSKRLIDIDAEDLLARPERLYDFLPEKDALWLRDRLEGNLADPADRQRTVIFPSAQKVFRLSIYPIRDEDSTRAIIALQDKTSEYQQQQALSDALENAHAASIAKSSFLSHMSHEIRTPMNAIIGMTTIALSRLGDPARVEDCLGKIAESSHHLLRLINDVLDMSKIENGKLSLNHEPFSLPAFIRGINEVVRPQAHARKLKFEIVQVNVDEEQLVGDTLRLNQILLNILSNALKFTAPGGSITLRIRQSIKNSTTLRLSFVIADTGIGMSEEFLRKIYVPFEQATPSTAAKYGGTGLGMSITFNLVSLMGGAINVRSREGQGTTFTVDIPFEYVESSRSRHDKLPSLRILVVDDDPGTCEHTSLLLEKMGLSVVSCTSGEQAVDLIRKAHEKGEDFDVCLLDWQMPGMNGGETARKIREVVGNSVLIIIISAYDWEPIEMEARAAGVTDFISKPFFASTLYDALLSSTQKCAPASDSKAPEQVFDFTGKRILLVEDNDFNREIAQEYLTMVHATVENAENGKQAVEKFTASPAGYYDIVLMDVQMPIMDGLEATRTIRASSHPDARKIRILAMTANAFTEDIARCMAAGMDDHIPKPIDVQQLYTRISVHLASPPRA